MAEGEDIGPATETSVARKLYAFVQTRLDASSDGLLSPVLGSDDCQLPNGTLVSGDGPPNAGLAAEIQQWTNDWRNNERAHLQDPKKAVRYARDYFDARYQPILNPAEITLAIRLGLLEEHSADGKPGYTFNTAAIESAHKALEAHAPSSEKLRNFG